MVPRVAVSRCVSVRALVLALVLAAIARADDALDAAREEVREAVEADRFEDAMRFADAALARHPGDALLRRERAKAIRGRARDLQRAGGYGPALDLLERHLDDPVTVEAYAETCVWAGAEDRGIAALGRATVDAATRDAHLYRLLMYGRRFGEIERRAAAAGHEEWRAWAAEEAARFGRYRARARRAWWIAAAGAAALAAAIAVLYRLPPPVPAAARPRRDE
jgi:hypothetical protein